MNKVIYCLLWRFSTVCKLVYKLLFLGERIALFITVEIEC